MFASSAVSLSSPAHPEWAEYPQIQAWLVFNSGAQRFKKEDNLRQFVSESVYVPSKYEDALGDEDWACLRRVFANSSSSSVNSYATCSNLITKRFKTGTRFQDALNEPLGYKIPLACSKYVKILSSFNSFELGDPEYGSCLDTFLDYLIGSSTSETAVVSLDSLWLVALKKVGKFDLLWNQHDGSSKINLRPDASLVFMNMLLLKVESKATLSDLDTARLELTSKFHPIWAIKCFPINCYSIPGVITCNEQAQLYSINYVNSRFESRLVKCYDLTRIEERALFIIDLFKLLPWFLSQTSPADVFHLVPNHRIRTRNNNFVTFTYDCIKKEFRQNWNFDTIQVIKKVYDALLPNVEHGFVNCKSISITRIGTQLKAAIILWKLDKSWILLQINEAVKQLHNIDIAHCDICLENVFYDPKTKSLFLGDLEYCRCCQDPPPDDIKRFYKCDNAMELDYLQLDALKDCL